MNSDPFKCSQHGNNPEGYCEQCADKNHEESLIKLHADELKIHAHAILMAACSWRRNMEHGTDHTDEGYSYPREEDEDALVEAVDLYIDCLRRVASEAPSGPMPG